MTVPPRVLVTGAGGKTGRAVVAALVARGARVRPLLHRPPAGPDAVVADQRDAGALTAALDGCDAVVAIAPNLSGEDEDMAGALVDACHRSGVRRLVLHSVVHPQLRAMPHHTDKARAEEVVILSGLDWSVLQPNAYAQNLAAYVPGILAGVLAVPYATDRPSALVDLEDVAEVAARCVVDGIARHATLELSGPEEVCPRQVAAIAADLVGRPVRAERVDPEAWVATVPDLDGPARARLLAMVRHYDHHGSPGDASVLAAVLGRAPGDVRSVLARLLATARHPVGPEGRGVASPSRARDAGGSA